MFPEALSPSWALQWLASPLKDATDWVLDQSQQLTEYSESDPTYVSLMAMVSAEECTCMEFTVPSSPISAAGRC